MNRLTEWIGNHTHGALICGDGYTKLAKYEDTGLEPEEVQKLIEEKKRYMPVDIGDVLYVPMPNVTKVIPCVRMVIGYSIDANKTILRLKNTRTGAESYLDSRNIGRVAFLTKEEAMECMAKEVHSNGYDD